MYNFDLRPLVWLGGIIVLIIWGIWASIDYFFISEDIVSTKPVKPTIELTVVDGKVDTLYRYKQ